MKDYLTECMDAFKYFGGKIISSASIPAKKDIFEKGNEEISDMLYEDKSDSFHHMVSKLLYVSKRARVDIDLGISNFCT